MNKHLLTIFLWVTMVALAGCGGGDDDTPTPPSPVNPDNPGTNYTLVLSPTSLSFESNGGQQTVTVTTNASAWTVESSQSWCKAEKSGDRVKVTAESNATQQQRTATITVKITGSTIQQSINVTQTNSLGQYCQADIPDEFVFNCEPTGIGFVLNTNIDQFQVTSSEAWCTAKVTDIPNATDKKQLFIEVADYQKKDSQGYYVNELPRKATITVTGGTVFSHTITIVQNSHIYFTIRTFLYPFVNGSLVLSPEGETKEVMIDTNCYSWTPKTEADWLTVKCIDNSTLSVTSKARDANDNTLRTGSVYIECDSDPYINITINVRDADSGIQGEDYGYDNPTGWD